MTVPKVSIIVPVYNVEKYLSACLDSLVNQTLRDIEIICVNDATQDASNLILEEFKHRDDRLVLLKHECNRGLSAARNTGLSIARGKYVYFMDSDDVLDLNAMEICFQEAERNSVDIVTFDAEVFYDSDYLGDLNFDYDRKITFAHHAKNVLCAAEMILLLLKTGTFKSAVWLLFIKRQILIESNLNFVEGLLHEDELFTPLLMIHSQTIMYLPYVFFHRRIRNNSIMTSQKKNVVKNNVMFIVRSLNLAGKDKRLQIKRLLLLRSCQLLGYIIRIGCELSLKEKIYHKYIVYKYKMIVLLLKLYGE